MKQIKIKIWIEEDGDKFYGPGPNELLKNIEKEGSLSKAAEKMKLSYKKAWELVRRLNQYSDEPLVILKKGGAHGGGAEISQKGFSIISGYEKLERKLQILANEEEEFLKFLK